MLHQIVREVVLAAATRAEEELRSAITGRYDCDTRVTFAMTSWSRSGRASERADHCISLLLTTPCFKLSSLLLLYSINHTGDITSCHNHNTTDVLVPFSSWCFVVRATATAHQLLHPCNLVCKNYSNSAAQDTIILFSVQKKRNQKKLLNAAMISCLFSQRVFARHVRHVVVLSRSVSRLHVLSCCRGSSIPGPCTCPFS